MSCIPLSQGLVALVDELDLVLLSETTWFAWFNKCTKTYYALRNIPGTRTRCTTQSMARLIMQAKPGQWVDHINHDTLDNRRQNLRLCSGSQNGANRLKLPGCSSRFKGVSWHNQGRKWCARIKKHGQGMHLGLFSDEKEAAQAYDRAAIRLFGDFALTNAGLGLLAKGDTDASQPTDL